MQSSKLAKWVNMGYPHLKAASGLSEWFLPERCFARLVTEVGAERLVSLMEPLGLPERLDDLLSSSPDPEALPGEAWEAAFLKWPPLGEVSAVAEACLEGGAQLKRHFMGGCACAPGFLGEAHEVYALLMVIAFAPFHAQGGPLLNQFAAILGADPGRPAELVRRFVAAVVSGDIITIEQVRGCIARGSGWLEWASGLVEVAQSLLFAPKLIAVTPAPSPELIGALAQMMKEMQDVDTGRNHREDPAGQGRAQ